MTYVLRLWVNDQLEETKESADVTTVMERFRDIVREWPNDWPHLRWFVSVNAEPGPFPARSFTVASYQHAARGPA
jgi:hypothetical protein